MYDLNGCGFVCRCCFDCMCVGYFNAVKYIIIFDLYTLSEYIRKIQPMVHCGRNFVIFFEGGAMAECRLGEQLLGVTEVCAGYKKRHLQTAGAF